MIVLPNFTIPKNLYRDLTSEATWRHKTLAEITRERLIATLDPSYSYNNKKSEAYYFIWQGTKLQYLIYPEKIKFDYIVAQKTSDIFIQIQWQTGYKDDALIKEIVARLAYTMNDPFYYEFIDREGNLVLSLFLIFLQTFFHLRPHVFVRLLHCVFFRVQQLSHKPD